IRAITRRASVKSVKLSGTSVWSRRRTRKDASDGGSDRQPRACRLVRADHQSNPGAPTHSRGCLRLKEDLRVSARCSLIESPEIDEIKGHADCRPSGEYLGASAQRGKHRYTSWPWS